MDPPSSVVRPPSSSSALMPSPWVANYAVLHPYPLPLLSHIALLDSPTRIVKIICQFALRFHDSSTKDALVKFTAKHNEPVHPLVKQEPPPTPAAHTSRGLYGRYGTGRLSDASSLHHFLLLIPPSRSPNAEVVHRDLTKALGLPHGEEFVLGDLREMNVFAERWSRFPYRF